MFRKFFCCHSYFLLNVFDSEAIENGNPLPNTCEIMRRLCVTCVSACLSSISLLPDEWLTHFSDIIGASHTGDFRMWEYGGIASEGVKEVAERGITKRLESELKTEVSSRTANY